MADAGILRPMGILKGSKAPPSTQSALSHTVVPPPRPPSVTGCASRPLSHWGSFRDGSSSGIDQSELQNRTCPRCGEPRKEGQPWRHRKNAMVGRTPRRLGHPIQSRRDARLLYPARVRRQGGKLPKHRPDTESRRNVFIEGGRGHAEFGDMQ